MSNVSDWVKKLVRYGKPFTVSKCTGNQHGLVADGTQISLSVRNGAAFVKIEAGEGDQAAWDECPLVGFEANDCNYLVGQISTKAGPMPLLVSQARGGGELDLDWQLDGESLAELEGAQGGGGGWQTGP